MVVREGANVHREERPRAAVALCMLEHLKTESGKLEENVFFTVKIALQVKLLQAQLNRHGKFESLHCDWYLYRVQIL